MAWQKIVLITYYVFSIVIIGLSIGKPRAQLTEDRFNVNVIFTGIICLLILSI